MVLALENQKFFLEQDSIQNPDTKIQINSNGRIISINNNESFVQKTFLDDTIHL